MATRRRSTTANGKKNTTKKTSTRSRTRKTTPTPVDDVEEPIDEPTAEPPMEMAVETVVSIPPEPAFAARVAPPPPPRPRPDQRRGIFLDVENTSRAQDVEQVLRYLMIDRVGIDTDFTAVGNWRVIGHETARLLARTGASLVHSAPSTGVRDWSDLRIAVAAGVWLAGARPGDMIDIVSDDQAFDAVGDVASSLGVEYRRLSYRSIKGQGHLAEEVVQESSSSAGRSRRRGRGGRGRDRERDRRNDRGRSEPSHRRQEPVRHHEPARHVAAPVAEDEVVHTAPHDELIEVVRDLMAPFPGGVTLDQLANALRERGFRRTPGSPRLITRLKRIKEIEVTRNGLIRVGNGDAPYAEPERAPARAVSIEPEDADVDEADEGEPEGDADAATGETAASPEGAQRRRRRRRGGRRRRGRRGGGGNGSNGEGDSGGGEVIAAAPPSSDY